MHALDLLLPLFPQQNDVNITFDSNSLVTECHAQYGGAAAVAVGLLVEILPGGGSWWQQLPQGWCKAVHVLGSALKPPERNLYCRLQADCSFPQLLDAV